MKSKTEKNISFEDWKARIIELRGSKRVGFREVGGEWLVSN
jgi:hypothetical protein